MPKVISRMCAVTRQVLPKTQLLRLVRTPDGTIQLDRGQKLLGRGTYVHKDAQTVASFCAPKKRQLWSHLLKCEITPEAHTALCAELQHSISISK